METPLGEGRELTAAVERLRATVADMRLPLGLPGQDEATGEQTELLHQLDDYVLPRLRSIDAPLLAVIGGSTGAGKSTLVNSIVGTEVSKSGVLRPTTTSPVLVHHPQDARWFTDQRILPGLSRVTGAATAQPEPGTVRLVASSALPAGMALLDAPDIDSVVAANRALAGQLLAAADLWLFVTTAARYADAVPWDLLRRAADRGTAVAIVLDRIDPDAIPVVKPHLSAMLREQGLPTAPVFTVPESVLTPAGHLPPEAMSRLKNWLEALAGDARARSVVVGQTLRGAIASLHGRAQLLATASREQSDAAGALNTASRQQFDQARTAVSEAMQDGTLLRGEVLARWQEFIGTGELFRQVESTVSRWRDRVTNAIKGNPNPSSAAELDQALHTGIAALLKAHGDSAAAQTVRTWRRLPGGESVLQAHPELGRTSEEFGGDVEAVVRGWQADLLDLIRSEGGNRRTNARIAAYGVNGIGLFLMLITFAHTGGLTGAEAGIAGGTSVLAQKVLEAIFGDQAVRDMSVKARKLLLERTEELYAAEQARFSAAVAEASIPSDQADRLLASVRAVQEVAA